MSPTTVTWSVQAGTTRHVKSADLNLRTGPDPNARVIVKLPQGTQVILLGETGTASDGGTWVKVRAGQQEGWVNQQFLE